MREMLALLILLCVTFPWAEAQTTSDATTDEGRILLLENAWNQAQQMKDTKALDLLLSETLVFTDYDGTFMNKSQYLASMSGESLNPQTIVSLSMKTHVYGNSAVVTGVYLETGTLKGKTYKRRERFSDTWINVKDTWQCVASQSTLIGR